MNQQRNKLCLNVESTSVGELDDKSLSMKNDRKVDKLVPHESEEFKIINNDEKDDKSVSHNVDRKYVWIKLVQI